MALATATVLRRHACRVPSATVDGNIDRSRELNRIATSLDG